MTYDLRPISAPRASGFALRVLTAVVENPVLGTLVAGKMLRDAGVDQLRRTDAGREPLPPTHPVDRAARGSDPDAQEPADVDVLGESGRLGGETVADFRAAYDEGRTDPVEVAERFLDAWKASEARLPPLRAMLRVDPDDVRSQARTCAERLRSGTARGPLEGVPVAVKDEIDQEGHPTTVGTRFLGANAAVGDAEVVRRLRAAGALLVGKAHMHEIGLGVTGLNPHWGAARNPWDPTRATGGSSSGPGAAVASGLCPIAIGADGGGSIRIPAALCGVVGLKPTFGRWSEHGAAPVCWSVAHLGPLARSARDAALVHRIAAGEDPADPNTLGRPAPTLRGVLDGDLAGLRIGVFEPWFEDADREVVARSRELLDRLVERGATVVDVEIPELSLLRAVHLVTIVSEMAAAFAGQVDRDRSAFGHDTRLALALARRLRADDYVQAQRHRERLCAHFARVLVDVHAIATPATGVVAPRLPGGAALSTGLSDLGLTERILRFCQPANVTGLPAISIPADRTPSGLPVGLQLMGRAWDEALLLRVAIVAEEVVDRAAGGGPTVSYRLLG